jgi:phenylacetate-coenzyme A ligase PaaK-like adenylate-forming protein
MSTSATSPVTDRAVSDSDQAARQALIRDALPDHIERLSWPAGRIATHQRDALRALLRTAIERSPFHARRLAGVDPAAFDLADLGSLPVMTKTEMMAAFDDVVTEPGIARSAVEAHLAETGFDATELPGGFTVLASGGSSGERGIFVYSRDAAAQFVLAIVRPGVARMLALLGSLPDDPPSLAVVAAGSAVHATRSLASLFAGDLMHLTSIAATDPLPEIVARLNDLQPLLLQGYPSTIRHLANEQTAGRLRIAPLSVTTSSEPLTTDGRARIGEAFGVGVCDQFGSSEGLVGNSPPDDPTIVLASDLCIVELVDNHGRPVPAGTASAKVLVTNLYNPVQPLIRYELTDTFTRQPDAASDGHLRVTVQGRSDDELRWGSVVVHPLVVRSVMVKTPAVTEYQVHQTPRGIDIACVGTAGFDPDGTRARLAAGLQRAGLRDPEVTVRSTTADRLLRHPVTGKTRRFVPLPPAPGR